MPTTVPTLLGTKSRNKSIRLARQSAKDFLTPGGMTAMAGTAHNRRIRLSKWHHRRMRKVRVPPTPRQTSDLTFTPVSEPREHLTFARYVPPSSIELRFADGLSSPLAVELLGMPVARISWSTVEASPTGEGMRVTGIRGDVIPIGSKTLRYLIDNKYAAEVDSALKSLQLSRAELRQLARDNPPPPEWFAQPERDLTRDSWK